MADSLAPRANLPPGPRWPQFAATIVYTTVAPWLMEQVGVSNSQYRKSSRPSGGLFCRVRIPFGQFSDRLYNGACRRRGLNPLSRLEKLVPDCAKNPNSIPHRVEIAGPVDTV
jgi:hypothetical protein